MALNGFEVEGGRKEALGGVLMLGVFILVPIVSSGTD